MKRVYFSLFILIFPFNVSSPLADDTELYVTNLDASTNGRPKVLIIFDNSGSMTNIVPGTKPEYDANTIYNTQGDISSERTYWSTDGTPPELNTDHYFLTDSNRCESALNSLNTAGTYTDYIITWRSKNNAYTWLNVNDSDGTRTSSYIDCKTDVDNANSGNPGTPAQANGYPLSTNSGPYTDDIANSDVNWNKKTKTLFTANYMNWYHDSSLATEDRERIDIAKEVINNIVNANPNVDFGLMAFNTNNSSGPHGGRVVQGITENMTDTQRTTLNTTISSINADTWTPLCETMYEAYRYFSGGQIYYGDDQSSPNPPRDMSVENNGNYISPIGDCQQVYVILMTDGEPTNDTNADSLINNLTGISSLEGNRLDELAGWLYSNDLDNDATNGTQRVITYTIGFTVDHSLLKDTAEKGGGRYYIANDAAELTNSFQGAINEILVTDTTFTSPSVAINSFNRTQSLDDIYFAIFRPEVGPRWHGNLKKLILNEAGELVDANNAPAIDPATGNIRDSAQTLWSTTPDGGRVLEGGVGALLSSRDPNTRVIKTNTGAGGSLEDFLPSNTNLTATDFSAADNTEKDVLIEWARGIDVDDEDTDENSTDTRPWIVGDPLHSQPLVINYGARDGHTVSNPDIRILLGTNHGVLHMFDADNGSEHWAFMPKELLNLNKTLRENSAANTHPYGIDGSVIAYINDNNMDGTISNGEKVYIFFGLRRGGNAYYALDISNPDSPVFLWQFDSNSTGFSELGQSWSIPIVTEIAGHNGPVLVIGGGYDTNKDASGVGTDDSVGRGIFIVDALSGNLIWSVTPDVNSASNLHESSLTDSIPAPIAALDGNGDGFTDRLYAPDTGGNLWRIDMPGSSLPSANQTTWSIFKLASLGGNSADDDRRFFNQVDVIRTRYGTLAYDGLALGSGNRAHPNETSVLDRFYLLRDTKITSAYHGPGGEDIPDPLVNISLYDATANLIQQGTESEQSTASIELLDKEGWYIDLEKTGEKNLSSSITLNSTTFFTTFAPDASTNTCIPIPGNAYLYAVDLHTAAAVYPWDDSISELTKEDRNVDIGSRLPDSVTPHFGEETIRIIGVGAGDNGSGSYDTGATLTTKGIYWYKEKP